MKYTTLGSIGFPSKTNMAYFGDNQFVKMTEPCGNPQKFA
jgi:hypothetical protein